MKALRETKTTRDRDFGCSLREWRGQHRAQAGMPALLSGCRNFLGRRWDRRDYR
jgi:hypothetical protein